MFYVEVRSLLRVLLSARCFSRDTVLRWNRKTIIGYLSVLFFIQNDRYVVAGFTNSLDSYAEFVLLDTAQPSGMVSDPSVLRLDANVDCTATLPREEAVTGLRNGDMVIWSMATGQPSRQLMSRSGNHAHSSEVKAVARSEDNRYLVSVSVDKTIKIWDMESERHVSTLFGHTDEVSDLNSIDIHRIVGLHVVILNISHIVCLEDHIAHVTVGLVQWWSTFYIPWANYLT